MFMFFLLRINLYSFNFTQFKFYGMKFLKPAILVFCFFISMHLFSKEPILTSKEMSNHPPKVIRMCCMFGYDVPVILIPGIKMSSISSVEEMGPHRYMGDPAEQNGIIYTRRGGFIDLGHLRDITDWTAYLYLQILRSRSEGMVMLNLGYEGGEKSLVINVPENTTKNDALLIAGRIAYDLSIWHEIATWYGSSSMPMIHERYSSFSLEDAYSNLTGVYVAIKAIQSDLTYDDAVTKILAETLTMLDAVSTVEETRLAMESVKDLWWTNEKRLPSRKVLIKREISVYATLKPWIVPGWVKDNEEPLGLIIPEFTAEGVPLNSYYELNFIMNHQFPFKKMFPDRKGRRITNSDFELVLHDVVSNMLKRGVAID